MNPSEIKHNEVDWRKSWSEMTKDEKNNYMSYRSSIKKPIFNDPYSNISFDEQRATCYISDQKKMLK